MPQPADISPASGPVTLIAIHGNGGGAFRFSLVAERIARDIRFVAPDLPGFSDVVRVGPLPTLRAYAEWLAEIVASTPAPRVLLGHGTGASLVLELLQRHRSLVDGVILHAPIASALEGHRFPRLLQFRVMRWVAQQSLSSPVLRPLWRARFFRAPLPPRLADIFFVNFRHCAAFGPMFDMITARWFESLRPVNVPAVLLWGGRDRVLGAPRSNDFAHVLPGATVTVEPAWDHFPMLDAPAAYATTVAEIARSLA